MAMDRQQFCTECGDPTGRAGNFHEEAFVKVPGEDEPRGPLCDSCAEKLAATYCTDVIYK